MNYSAPNCSRAMLEEGWLQFENTPIYMKRYIDNNNELRHKIVCSADIEGGELMYERAYTEGIISYERLKEGIVRYITVAGNHDITPVGLLCYEDVLKVAAEFYWCHRDMEKYNEYVSKYELLTGLSYEDR